MNISVFGLGYVGSVSVACFSKLGHNIIGIDINPDKVRLINEAVSPVVEEGIQSLLKQGLASKRVRATTDIEDAVINSDVSFVCVGTPGNKNGELDMEFIFKVVMEIGDVLAKKAGAFHTIAVRSTIMPGTILKAISLIEKQSGKKHGIDFAVVANPEFLREGSAVKDFFNPPYTILGTESQKGENVLKTLYEEIRGETYTTSVSTAEIIKLVNNSFHALKVTFANEVGRICKPFSIDSHDVMDIFSKDTKLNISKNYLKPGFAFGGSCLPKDLNALCRTAKNTEVEAPMLCNIALSNRAHINLAIEKIIEQNRKKIGIVGISFKENTDDLRESPMVDIVETLLGKGYELKIYDSNINLSMLIGANKSYLEEHIPHISSLLTGDLDELMEESDVVVVGNWAGDVESFECLTREKQVVIDLVRFTKKFNGKSRYIGLCW